MTRFFATASLLAVSFAAVQASAEILIAPGDENAVGNGSMFSDPNGVVAPAAVGVNTATAPSTNANGRALIQLGGDGAVDFSDFSTITDQRGVQISGWTNYRWFYMSGNSAMGWLENGGRLGVADQANNGQAFANGNDWILVSDAYSPASGGAAADTFNISALTGSDVGDFTLTTYLVFDDTTITQVDTRTISGNPDPDDLSLTGLAPNVAYNTVRVLFAVDSVAGGRGLIDDVTFEQVPEPGSLALLGLGGLLIARRRRG